LGSGSPISPSGRKPLSLHGLREEPRRVRAMRHGLRSGLSSAGSFARCSRNWRRYRWGGKHFRGKDTPKPRNRVFKEFFSFPFVVLDTFPQGLSVGFSSSLPQLWSQEDRGPCNSKRICFFFQTFSRWTSQIRSLEKVTPPL
jgi:hypothetical protein